MKLGELFCGAPGNGRDLEGQDTGASERARKGSPTFKLLGRNCTAAPNLGTLIKRVASLGEPEGGVR